MFIVGNGILGSRPRQSIRFLRGGIPAKPIGKNLIPHGVGYPIRYADAFGAIQPRKLKTGKITGYPAQRNKLICRVKPVFQTVADIAFILTVQFKAVFAPSIRKRNRYLPPCMIRKIFFAGDFLSFAFPCPSVRCYRTVERISVYNKYTPYVAAGFNADHELIFIERITKIIRTAMFYCRKLHTKHLYPRELSKNCFAIRFSGYNE